MKKNIQPTYIPYSRTPIAPHQMCTRSQEFSTWMNERRTLREFSDQPIPREVIENIIMSASSAPSGAHKQPWTFCAISDPDLKREIRKAAEEEEYKNYHGRMSDTWLEDLVPFGTNWKKPFFGNGSLAHCYFSEDLRTRRGNQTK